MAESRRGIYLLPNLLTTLGLFAGFYGIIAAVNGVFDTAALAIFLAGIMDGLDGRVARMTNTQSAFGAQYDSMTDMVAFGIAPAILVYLAALQQFGKFGWMLAFLYAAAVAMRLARFNVQSASVDKGHFQGLSSPASAGLVIAAVWVAHDYQINNLPMSLFIGVVTFCGAALMVSNIRFNSFKNINFRERITFVTGVTMVAALAVFASDPPLVLLTIALAYAISGPVLTLIQVRRARDRRQRGESTSSE